MMIDNRKLATILLIALHFQMLLFFLFSRISVVVDLPVDNYPVSSIFATGVRKTEKEGDSNHLMQIFGNLGRSSIKQPVLCAYREDLPMIYVFYNKTGERRLVSIETTLLGRNLVIDSLRNYGIGVSDAGEYYISSSNDKISGLEIIEAPEEIKMAISNLSYSIVIYGDYSDAKLLKCGTDFEYDITNFKIIAVVLLITYVVLRSISFKPISYVQNVNIVKGAKNGNEIISQNQNGLERSWEIRVTKPLIGDYSVTIDFGIVEKDQHIHDSISFGYGSARPHATFSPINEAEVSLPIVLGDQTPIIHITSQEPDDKDIILASIITIEYSKRFLKTVLNSIIILPKKEEVNTFMEYIADMYDFAYFAFYSTKDGINKQLFHADRSNGKAVVPDSLLNEIEITELLHPTFFYKYNNYIVHGSKNRFGKYIFSLVVCIDIGSPILTGIQDYIHRFYVLILSFWQLSIYQKESEYSFSNYTQLLQSSHAFVVSEYFDDLSLVGSFGLMKDFEQDFWTQFIKMVPIEQRPTINHDLGNLINNNITFSQVAYRLNFPDEVRWISLSGRRSYDEFYGQHVVFLLAEDITHLHSMEIKIQETLHDVSLASTLLGLHKFIEKKDHRLLITSHDLLTELGYHESNDRDMKKLIHPDDLQKILECEVEHTTTIRLKKQSDDYLWYTVVCTSRHNRMKGFLFSVQELTQLQTSVQSTRDCFQIGSATNSFAFWAINLESTEPPHSVFLTKPYKDIIRYTHPDFHHLLSLETLLALDRPMTLEIKLRLIRKMDYKWFSLTLIPTGGKQLLCFALNIDEKKQMRDLLNQTEQLLDLAFTYTDVHMWCFDDTYEGSEQILTCEPDQQNLVMMDWNTLEHNLVPEYQDTVRDAFKRALSGQEKFELEVPFFFDSLHWLLMRGLLVADSKVPRMMGIYLDLTAIKEASHELEVQKARAEEASMAKSMFLANMSHEIRTPLNGICGLLEILQSTELTNEQKELSNIIQSSFMELLELLNDTLDLAKLESHKLIPLSVKFDPCEVVSQLQDGSFVRKKNSNVEFRIFMKPTEPIFLRGDPHCFLRIVTNLVSNAIKFTKIGCIDIRMHFDNGFIVDVSDSGSGMAESRLQNISDHFDHGEMMAVYENSCVGVGLSLVTEMIRFMNGSISLSSVVGKGSTFTFTLPFEPIYTPFVPNKSRNSGNTCYIFYNDEDIVANIGDFAQFYGFNVKKLDKIEDAVDLKEFDVLMFDGDHGTSEEYLIKELDGGKLKNVKIGIVSHRESPLIQNRAEVFVKPLKPHQLRSFFGNIHFGRKKVEEHHEPSGPVEIKVLAVDDNATNQLVMKKMLTKLGCSFKVVVNGAEAVEAVKQEHFDIILMDQFMPVLDGPQATKMIRDMGGKYLKIPIIAMTASLMQEDEEACKKAGMNAFICKPVTLRCLSKTIDQFTRRHD